MKLSFRITSIVLFFAIIFVLSGCSGDDDNSNPLSSRESAFVGTWVLTKITVTDLSGTYFLTPEQANMSMTIQVNSDKTFSTSSTIDGQNQTQSGTWNLNGDYVSLVAGGETEFLEYTVDGNKFTIKILEPDGDIFNSRILEFTKQ